MKSIEELILSSEINHFKKQKHEKAESRVLVIGDLHEPFSLDEYFDHCQVVQSKYNCNKIIFIGDVIDNHYSSYHETCPDGYSAGQELDIAKQRLQRWYKMFPKADIVIGNHDRMAFRKAYSNGISSQWVKGFNDVLNTPKWNFVEEVDIDGVLYCHGEGKKARLRVKDELCSIVQGHYHSEAYVEYMVGSTYKVFAMQVGSGIDKSSYAMAYGRHFKKPCVSCGVVIGGKKAYLEMMEL